MQHTVSFFPLVIVTVLAVLVPVVLHRLVRLPIPIVVGEILAGIVVGQSGVGLVSEPGPALDFLKKFGFAYLMFLSGLEVDFDLLWRRSRGILGAEASSKRSGPLRPALFSFGATLALSLGFSHFLVLMGYAGDPLIMALILSTTSLGVVMPVLKERGVLRSPLGQNILVASVVGDFATVLLISTYIIFRTEGPTFEVLLVLVLLAATFLVYRLGRLFRRHLPLEKLFEDLSHATGQLDTRAALALAVIFIGLAEGLGIEAILGAFLAGTIVSLLSPEETSDLRYKLNALGYGFFIPVFFIMVGVDFDLRALVSRESGIFLVLLLLGMAYAVKFLAALIYRRSFTWRETLAIGAITSARLSLIIAVAAIAVEIHAISPATNSAVVVVAIATVVISPLVFHRLIPALERKSERILLVGSLPHVGLLARRLRDRGERVSIVTANRRFAEESQEVGLECAVVEGGDYVDGLKRAGIEDARSVVSMTERAEDILKVVITARELYGIETVAAYVQDPALAERLKAEGVRVIDPALSLVTTLEAMVLQPHVFSILTESEMGRSLRVVTMRNPAVEGHALRELSLPGDALVLVVSRHGEAIIPRGNTRLERGDLLTVVGLEESLDEAVELLELDGDGRVP